MSRPRLIVALLALATMAGVAAVSPQTGLGAVWAVLLCLLIAALALFWPEPERPDPRLLEEIADALGGAKTPEALGARLRAVLSRHFHNVYMIGVEGASERPQLRCLHEVLPPSSGAPLPARFAGGELAPIALLLQKKARVHVGQAEEGSDEVSDPRSLRRFWRTYGLASLWPARADENEEVRGLIALGSPSAAPLSTKTLLTIARLFGSGLALLDERETLAGRQRELQQTVTHAHQSLSLALDDLEQARLKLVEAEKQAMVGRLAAGIVHEINSPLGTLASATDTVERATARARAFIEAHTEGPEAANARRALRAVEAQLAALQVMRQGQERLKEVAERIGRFANLDSAEVKRVDLRTCVEDAVALVEAQSASRQIAFSLQLPSAELEISCFPAKLNHAFFNLVENAAAAIEGAGEVSVSVTRKEGSKGSPSAALVEITDTGRGIPREKLPGLLNLAFTTRIGGRVGLRTGLPATRQTFIELGGDLTIESEPGKGSRVVATLILGRETSG